MEIEELLTRAWGAVEKAGIPEPLQEFAFKEALSLLSVASTDTPSETPSENKSTTAENPTDAVDSSDRALRTPDAHLFEKFSQESGVPREQLERLYYFDAGLPHLNGPKTRFGSNVADQSRAVALAITAAYDYAIDHQSVAASTVRAECERLKCDPDSNWNKVMNALTTVNFGGAPGKRTMRVKSDTGAALQNLAKTALGIE